MKCITHNNNPYGLDNQWQEINSTLWFKLENHIKSITNSIHYMAIKQQCKVSLEREMINLVNIWCHKYDYSLWNIHIQSKICS